jgi:methylmalonyl-CoA mutase
MTPTMTDLSKDFPAPRLTDWLALVEKTLGGGDVARLRSRTADGVVVEPLYTPDNAAPAQALSRRPGLDPLRAWDIRRGTEHPDPARANADVLADLDGGAASVSLRLDPSGRDGIAVASPADLARVLDGVLLDLAPVALDAGFMGAQAAGWLAQLAKGAPTAPLAFNLDPLGAFAKTGASPGAMTTILERDAALALGLAETYPKAKLFTASGAVVHEAGGSEGQELGFALACALAYVRALTQAGASLTAAFWTVSLNLSADADYFLTLAKLRAARILMGRLGAACDVEVTPTIEARSSRRMLSRLDPWVNLLRLTAAGFGAAQGGADVIQLDPFTQPLGHPSPLARRQARNTQLVLMEESELGRVADPAAGSWFLDSLTDQLARAGWAAFQAIEADGGALVSLTTGALAQRVATVRETRAADIAKRKAGLIGASQFANPLEAPVELDRPDPAAFAKPAPVLAYHGAPDACAPLTPSRLAEPFEALRDRAAALGDARVFLATLGEPADHAARVNFARGLCEVGGLVVETGAPSDERGALSPVAILCGSDSAYADAAVSAAGVMKAAGISQVWLAGRPGDLETALAAAGVRDFVFVGCDVVAVLDRMLTTLEQAR